jgi:hypothetical protein
MKNPNSHILLYAKHWYKRGYIIKDMKILIGERSGIEPKYIDQKDIFIVLFGIVYPYIKEEHPLREFLSDIISGFLYIDQTVFERFIKVCLSVLSNIPVKEGNKILIELDEPDYTLLPKRED